MDIVKHINQHTENLKQGLADSSFEQRKSLTIALLGFYFQWSDFEDIISKYIKIDISKKQLVSDINSQNVDKYQKANEKSIAQTDEYSDDYEEPEPIELFLLDAFANATDGLENTDPLVGLFIGIIDLLDYYENFSDEPEFWNTCLDKEVEFQNETLIHLKSVETFDALLYQKRYDKIEFGRI